MKSVFVEPVAHVEIGAEEIAGDDAFLGGVVQKIQDIHENLELPCCPKRNTLPIRTSSSDCADTDSLREPRGSM